MTKKAKAQSEDALKTRSKANAQNAFMDAIAAVSAVAGCITTLIAFNNAVIAADNADDQPQSRCLSKFRELLELLGDPDGTKSEAQKIAHSAYCDALHAFELDVADRTQERLKEALVALHKEVTHSLEKLKRLNGSL